MLHVKPYGSNPAELDKSLFAGIIYAKRVYNSATVTNQRRIKYFTTAAALIALVMVAAPFAATPVLSMLEINGCNRGLALTIGADAPFVAAIHTIEKGNGKSSIVEISCSNVIYGLNDYSFTAFPAGCPLKQITAVEDKTLNSVKFSLKILAQVEKNIRYKQKDNRWLILLSSAPFNNFTWSARAGETKKPGVSSLSQARAAASDAVYLQDISILHREQVENVIFKFSGPVAINIESNPDRITANFVNAKNGLPRKAFKPGNDGLVKSISLEETTGNNAILLEASISINRDNGMKPLAKIFSDRLVIYGVSNAQKSIYFWSARNGMALSYNFISPEQFPVDYRKIEKKAISDSRNSSENSGTFSVDDRNEVAPAPAASTRIVIIKDNVNLRSRPTRSQAGAVIVRLPIGTAGNQLGRNGLWRNVEIDGNTGWIMGRLVMDSVNVPAALWKRIKFLNAVKEKRNARAGVILPVTNGNLPPLMPGCIESDQAIQAAASGKSNSNDSVKLMIQYDEYGRDPFLPLSQDEDGSLPGIENLKLVGILYDASDRIALFEDSRNKSKTYTLREKDMVRNGILSRIRPDRIMFSISELGISRTYWMKLDKMNEDEKYGSSSSSAIRRERHAGKK
jgi:hypothetical protein